MTRFFCSGARYACWRIGRISFSVGISHSIRSQGGNFRPGWSIKLSNFLFNSSVLSSPVDANERISLLVSGESPHGKHANFLWNKYSCPVCVVVCCTGSTDMSSTSAPVAGPSTASGLSTVCGPSTVTVGRPSTVRLLVRPSLIEPVEEQYVCCSVLGFHRVVWYGFLSSSNECLFSLIEVTKLPLC